MAKKKESCDCPKCLPNWLAAFGDLMSLLLCFFVLLLSMSSMDARKVEDAIGSLAGALSVLEGGSKTEISREKQQQDNPVKLDNQSASAQNITKTIEDVNEMLESNGAPKAVLEESEDGFIIQLPASLLFKPASATIENDDALLFLKRIALIIARMPQDIRLDVIGFTDEGAPPPNSAFKDNWELSTARAVSVSRELIKDRVKPERLIASGRAEFDPIASNATQEGRAKNRRVELHFYSTDTKSKEKAKKSVLDQAQEAK